MDKETLKNFYFSKANDFSKFQKAKQSQETPSVEPVKGPKKAVETTAAGSGVAAALAAKAVDTTVVATITKAPSTEVASVKKSVPTAKAAPVPVSASTPSVPQLPPSAVESTPTPNSAHSITSEYLVFLKQQQDLQKFHNLIEHTVMILRSHIDEQVKSVNGVRQTAQQMLTQAETSTQWNLQSKYTSKQLVTDAGMGLTLERLLASGRTAPSIVELQHHIASFSRLKQDHGAKPKYQAHKLVVENMLRRLERSTKEILTCTPEADAAAVAKVVDHYFVHLDHVMTVPTVDERCVRTNELISHLSQRHSDCVRAKDEALDDGDMAYAEKCSYMQVEILEELVAAVIDKIRIVSTCLEENAVNDKVQNNYATSTKDYANKVRGDQGKLKESCETDLKRLFELRTKVDALDEKATKRLNDERARLDKWLDDNANEQLDSWTQINNLLERIVSLERDRHDVVKLRIEEKQKQEQRQREYTVFCEVADEHGRLLDSTIKNCESAIHCANVLGDSVDAGFHALHVEFGKLDAELNKTLLETHHTHHEAFRNLYFSLGDLLLKREKKVEEIDSNIQAAHIQQELCSDSLNPNAKKFSDMKRDLLALREDLERDMTVLKQRATVAADAFIPTDEALSRSSASFVSPVEEQEDRRLQQRGRMLEYKALAIRNVEAAPLKEELSELQRQLGASKKMVGQS